MKRIMLLIYFIFFANAIMAQTVITGSVKDKSGDAITGAIVTVKDTEKTVAYAIAKSDGTFKLTVRSDKKELVVSVTMMSYAKEERVIKNGSQVLDFVLKEETSQLKEAVVSAPVVTRIGDTLRFSLPALVSKGDVSLEDALKKVPGISVAENGEIKYLGKSVSNFYVEGLEMLNGNYTLTTRNLPAEHVASVEVLNNHNSVKMEKDRLSDNVALNVKLKKNAMFKPVGTSEAALGYSADRLLYTVGATGMVFGSKGQVLASLKTGNIDDFALSQTMSLSSGGQFTSHLAVNATGKLDSSAPSLSKNRYLNLDGRLATVNSIIKLSDDKTLRVNVSYAWQRQQNTSSLKSEYFLSDGETLTLTQMYDLTSAVNQPKVSLDYTQNADNKYIRNTFEFFGNFADNTLPVEENGIPVEQSQGINSYNLADNLVWAFKTGKIDWDSQTRLQMAKTPSVKLVVTSPQESYNAEQNASSQTFALNQSLNTSFKFGNSRISLPINLDLSSNEVGTDYVKAEQSVQNLVKGFSSELSIRPTYSYTSSNRRFTLSSGLATRAIVINGHNQFNENTKLDVRKLIAEPRVNMTFAVTPESEIAANASLSHNYGGISTLLSNPVLHNYRSVSSELGTMTQNSIAAASLSWRYSNPISLWFGTWMISYTDISSNVLSSQYMTEDNTSLSFVTGDNHSQSVSTNAEITKRISSIKGNFSVRGGWNGSRSGMIQQNNFVTYYGTGLNAGADFNMQPIDWFGADLVTRWSLTGNRYASVNNAYRNITGRLTLSFYPVKNLILDSHLEYSHRQLSDGNYKDLSLFDASVSYKIKSMTLKLSANNLLDQKRYAYTVFNGLDTMSYDFSLRPREIVLSVQFSL